MKSARRGLASMFRAFANRNYRLYYFGQLVSMSGTWMQRLAQSWLVLQLTNSPLALGGISILQFGPLLVLALFGGVLADRLPKRRLLVISQAAMAVQAAVLAALVTSGQVQLWHIYALALVLGLANAVDNPTRQAFVMEMVGPQDVQNAVALNSSLFNVTRIVGPAFGGMVVAAAGVAACFWLNALSYVAVIGALLAMRPAEFYGVPTPGRGRMLSQIAEGVAYALRSREICLLLIVVFTQGTFGQNFNIFLPLLARYVLDVGPFGLGLLFTSVGIGSVAMALALAPRRDATERMLLVGSGAFSVLLAAVALAAWLPLTMVLLAGLGATSILFSATANTRLQMISPPALRGRLMSLQVLLSGGTAPIGGLLIGSLSEHLGVPQALITCASLCALGLAAALLYARLRPAAPPRSAPA